MNDKIVTVLKLENSTEAHFAKTLLENNGIPSFVADENLVEINPQLVNAVGYIKLQIKECDMHEAIRILMDNDVIKERNPNYNLGAKPCPNCGSKNVTSDRASAIIYLFSILLLFIPLILRKKQWRCHNCQYSWIESITSQKVFLCLLILPVLLFVWLIIYLNITDSSIRL